MRHLHRIPHGTTKTEIGDYVRKVLDKIGEITYFSPAQLSPAAPEAHFIVDCTAVGEPAVGRIEEQANQEAQRAVIRGQHTETYSDGVHYISKQILLAGIEVSLEKADLKIAEGLPETSILIEEFRNFRNRPPSAVALHDDIWREQPGDDLVFAVAIACWKLRQLPDFRYDRI